MQLYKTRHVRRAGRARCASAIEPARRVSGSAGDGTSPRDDSSDAFDGVHVPKRTRQLFLAVSLLVLAVYLVLGARRPDDVRRAIIFDTTGVARARKARHPHAVAAEVPGPGGASASDGRQAGIYGIGTSVVGVPLYLVGKAVAQISPPAKRAQIVLTATMFTNALVTAATVFMLMLVCMLLGAPPAGAVLVGLSYGLGSYAYPHALTLFTEPGTALLPDRRGVLRDPRRRAGARVRSARVRRVGGRGAAVPRVGRAVPPGARAVAARRRVAVGLPTHELAVGAWSSSACGSPRARSARWCCCSSFNWWRYGSPTNLGYALGTATDQSYPIVRGVANQWFSSGKSIFLYAPIAIIVVCGLVRSVRKLPMEMLLLGALVVVNTLFFARVQFWSGDWAWGPRYLQIVVPCLAAMAAPLMDSRGVAATR